MTEEQGEEGQEGTVTLSIFAAGLRKTLPLPELEPPAAACKHGSERRRPSARSRPPPRRAAARLRARERGRAEMLRLSASAGEPGATASRQRPGWEPQSSGALPLAPAALPPCLPPACPASPLLVLLSLPG